MPKLTKKQKHLKAFAKEAKAAKPQFISSKPVSKPLSKNQLAVRGLI